MKDKKIGRNDFLFAGAVLLTAVVFYAGYWFFNREAGSYVRVTVDGTVYGMYPLWEENDIVITGAGGAGENRLIIKDKKAAVTSADCADKLCVKQRAVSKTGESIICLPHRVVITVTGAEEAEYDGITG